MRYKLSIQSRYSMGDFNFRPTVLGCSISHDWSHEHDKFVHGITEPISGFAVLKAEYDTQLEAVIAFRIAARKLRQRYKYESSAKKLIRNQAIASLRRSYEEQMAAFGVPVCL